MTTIVYKDGVIAYDSRITAGDVIITDNFDKKHENDGITFFISGNVANIEEIMAAYPDKEIDEDVMFASFVVDEDGGLFMYYSNGDGIACKMNMAHFSEDVIGSGRLHALTAMDFGADAEGAVKAAMKRDTCTGGLVRTFVIGETE